MPSPYSACNCPSFNRDSSSRDLSRFWNDLHFDNRTVIA
jgi:hypothetical protein